MWHSPAPPEAATAAAKRRTGGGRRGARGRRRPLSVGSALLRPLAATTLPPATLPSSGSCVCVVCREASPPAAVEAVWWNRIVLILIHIFFHNFIKNFKRNGKTDNDEKTFNNISFFPIFRKTE
jgi:hypothetical protein